MVYDCFSFFNELDLLEIRLNILNSVVDKFILVEATKTHSNNDKPLYFNENKDRFKNFSNKIIHIIIDEYPEYTTSWAFENNQRNEILRGLVNCKPDDVIMISDVDEIPNPLAVKNYTGTGIAMFDQRAYLYFLNYKPVFPIKWNGTRILRYKSILNNDAELYEYKYSTFLIEKLNQSTTPTKIRMISNLPIIKKGGWHFTYLGGYDSIKYKLRSFAHQEFNTEKFTLEQFIKRNLDKGIDLFNPKDNRYIPVHIAEDFPEYLIKNQYMYTNLIYPIDWKTKYRNLMIILSFSLWTFLIRRPYIFLKKVYHG